MLNQEEFTILLQKYTADEITAAERSLFLEAVVSGAYDDLLLNRIEQNLASAEKDIAGANLAPHRSSDILHKILSSEKQNALLIPRKSGKAKFMRWAVAAAIIGVVALSFFLIKNAGNKPVLSNIPFTKDMVERANTTNQPQRLELEEGSIVTLQPGSSIHYPLHFLPGKREIFLEGEAFFEVSKNTSRPFFVYNKNIVTRVLGTSFNIKTYPGTRQMEVSVRTGRVEVYEDKSGDKVSAGKKDNGVILLPNQKVTYNQDTRQFVPSLVEIPLPIITEQAETKTPTENFVFEETPLRSVLTALEKTYGIEIMVEEDNIYKCLFTGDVGQPDLYTRLDIICQAVQASYEVKGTKILIKGKGCN